MIALCECQGFPDPAKCFNDPNWAPWLYALPWYADSSNGVPCSVLNTRVNNSYMINAKDLPDFSSMARIAPSTDNARTAGGSARPWGLSFPAGRGWTMTIYNSAGKVCFGVNNGDPAAARRMMHGLRSGMYLVRLKTPGKTQTLPIVMP
jgi:hypothetical protein